MSELDPDRFTIRHADTAREAYAWPLEKLDLVRVPISPAPNAGIGRLCPEHNVRVGSHGRRDRDRLYRAILATSPLRGRR
jgi:hypothetical protein